MVDIFNLYISAADDLQLERDLLSRIVTKIPVTLGWQIHFSPIGKKALVEKFIAEANLHILILGTDIRAPIGYEWHLSHNLRRKPILFIKSGIARTPAAADFHRSLSKFENWHQFQDLSELRLTSLEYIGQFILDQAKFFSLGSEEYERLSEFLNKIEEDEPEEFDSYQSVAGEDSVILSRERFVPRDGVLIQAPDESNQEE